jgi:hypothetical protein
MKCDITGFRARYLTVLKYLYMKYDIPGFRARYLTVVKPETEWENFGTVAILFS